MIMWKYTYVLALVIESFKICFGFSFFTRNTVSNRKNNIATNSILSTFSHKRFQLLYFPKISEKQLKR